MAGTARDRSRPRGSEPEAARLLVCVRDVRGPSRERLLTLLRDADGQRLGALLARERLLPLACDRLAEAGAGGPAAAAVAERARQSRRIADARGNIQDLVTLQIAATLERAGVACAPLKGAALSRALYGSPSYRLSTDIDVLVPPDRIHDAIAELCTLGYHQMPSPTPRGSLPLLHHELTMGDGSPTVEVHWRVHWYEGEFAAAALRRSRPDADGVRRMTPADELAALLLFYARDGFAGLRLAADIATWWDIHGGELADGALEQIVRSHPRLERALVTSARAAGRVVGLPAGRLFDQDRSYSRLALRLADWRSDAEVQQIAAQAALVDWLLAPPGSARAYVRRQIIKPPAHFELERPELAGRPLRTRVAQGEHAVRLTRRMALGVAALRARR